MAIADNADGVDIGGLAEEAGFGGMIFVDAVNEAGQCVAYSGFIFVEGDFLLGEHKFFEAIVSDAIGDLVRQAGGRSSLFGVEWEAAEVIETCPVYEFE